MTSIPPKGIVVVEFWATWCEPCRESIPHLTELAKKYKNVRFIGVGIWEADGKHIDAFVKKMGSKMGYAVAYSGDHTSMAKTWMEAAKQTGIPTAFIVKDGIIQWIGLPWNMETPLAEVVKSKLDLKASKRAFLQSLNSDAQADKEKAQLAEIAALFDKGERTEAKRQLKAFEATRGAEREGGNFVTLEIRRMHFYWLSFEDKDAFIAAEHAILKDSKDEWGRVGVVPPVILQLSLSEASFGLTADAVKILVDETKDPQMCRFAAIVHARMKQPSESARYAQMGLDLLKDKSGEAVEKLRKDLRFYIK